MKHAKFLRLNEFLFFSDNRIVFTFMLFYNDTTLLISYMMRLVNYVYIHYECHLLRQFLIAWINIKVKYTREIL